VIPTAPRRARDRLAELVVAAFHDRRARVTLDGLAHAGAVPADWLGPDDGAYAQRVLDRARRAAALMHGRPMEPAPMSLAAALAAAADLFDAGLGFEAHEVLEPHWALASPGARQSLQGLIQVAVGYQHLANGNAAGALALLRDGAAHLRAGRLADVDVDAFVTAVEADAARLPGGTSSPAPFPRPTRSAPRPLSTRRDPA
jgi:hypothetical protein